MKSRRHAIGQIGDIETKIELHTEFTACTLIANNCTDKTEIEQTYRRVLSPHNIQILSKCMVVIVSSAKETRQTNTFRSTRFWRHYAWLITGAINAQTR